MGVVCPLGNSPAEVWDALSSGRSGVEPLQSMPPLDGLVTFAGEARKFTGHIDDFGSLPKDRKKAIRKALKVMCRETMMAVASAQQAIGDGGFAETPMAPERSGVVFGSDYMLSPPEDFIAAMNAAGVADADFRFGEWGVGGLGEMNPLWMLKYLPNMPASHIGIFNDLRGPNNSLTLREASGGAAICEAGPNHRPRSCRSNDRRSDRHARPLIQDDPCHPSRTHGQSRVAAVRSIATLRP